MKKIKYFYFVFAFIFLACGSGVRADILNESGMTVKDRFNTPAGYERVKADSGSFAEYLRSLPLKEHGAKVYYHSGEAKWRQNVHAAVTTVDTGKKDLQQCADAVIRLRAEYLYKNKKYDDIRFNFTSGFNAQYSRWRKGERVKVSGNKVSWYQAAKPSDSYESFKKYLETVFMYAGTISLSKELKKKAVKDMRIGDVFIQAGSPGHAVIVADMAEDKDGNKIFMLAQSYMPAQDIHILKNFTDKKISPWYKLDFGAILNTPEWTFTDQDLKSF
ncbi:hypothetical protein Dip518_001100 [Parelusimicrobium proximum]|uniref:DUF4846 domain-containing protein n=1 Tax=Parelusimicrobium proximum TaxID=3228953 RepID=UPI003D167B7D